MFAAILTVHAPPLPSSSSSFLLLLLHHHYRLLLATSALCFLHHVLCFDFVPPLRAGAYLSIPLVFLYPVLTLCKDHTWLLWPLICIFAVWRTTSFSIMFTSVMMLINNRFHCATIAIAPSASNPPGAAPAAKQSDSSTASARCAPLVLAAPSTSPPLLTSLCLQGLASLTSTIAPAAGGSIYAYFSSLNKVLAPTVRRQSRDANHVGPSRFRSHRRRRGGR